MDPFSETVTAPMMAFQQWLADAGATEPNDPSAAALATATRDGMPSVRMVLTKGADERGVRFFSSSESQKGWQIEDNPQAALCFHWKSLRRQVRFEGSLEELTSDEAAGYFYTRSRGSQIAAAVSVQSRPLASREALDAAVASYTAQLGDAQVPVPQDWVGYVLIPRTVEFWRDGKDRLHDRIRFTREGNTWTTQRLYP